MNTTEATGNDPDADNDPQDADDAASSDVDEQVDHVMRIRRRFRRLQEDMWSSSEDDSDDEISIDNDDASSENDDSATEAAAPEEPTKTLPPDPWHQVVNIRQRELGYGSRANWSHKFRTECGRSLSFVRRLERSMTLDHHQGCVNALHFNKSGEISGLMQLGCALHVDSRMYRS